MKRFFRKLFSPLVFTAIISIIEIITIVIALTIFRQYAEGWINNTFIVFLIERTVEIIVFLLVVNNILIYNIY